MSPGPRALRVPQAPGLGRRLLSMVYESFLVFGIYFVACWSRAGRTLPMQTWKLRLVRGENLPVGAGRALLRYALAWPSLLLLGGGFLWAFLDRDRQFLHDRLAGTRIVTTETGKREG